MSEQPGLSRRALLGLFRRPRDTEGAATPHRAPVAPVAPVRVASTDSPRAAVATMRTTSTDSLRAPVAAVSVSSADALHAPAEQAPVAPAWPFAAPSAGTPAPPPAFSLESFYASRARSGEATVDGRIPVFSLREGLVVPQRVPEDDGGPGRQSPRATQPIPADTTGAPPCEAPRDGGLPMATPGTDTASPQVARRGGARAPALGATVRVRTGLCLAWQGSFCTTCVERCPIEGAIALDAGRPRVVAERCDGCGTCVRVCPAPLNAFELRPAGASGASS